MEFDLNYLDLKKDFINSANSVKNYFPWLKNFKFSFINATQANLNHLLVNNAVNFSTKLYLKDTCYDCSLCKYRYDYNFLKINFTFRLPLYTNSSCNLSNCVYIILCIKCDVYYIGQTSKSFKTRLKQHLYNIKKFKPFINKTSEVGAHFALKNHVVDEHLRFCIFRANIANRLSVESDLINLFLILGKIILNEKIPNNNFIKKFCFI